MSIAIFQPKMKLFWCKTKEFGYIDREKEDKAGQILRITTYLRAFEITNKQDNRHFSNHILLFILFTALNY